MTNSTEKPTHQRFNYKGKLVYETPEFRRVFIPALRLWLGWSILCLLGLGIVTVIWFLKFDRAEPWRAMSHADLFVVIMCLYGIISVLYFSVYFAIKRRTKKKNEVV